MIGHILYSWQWEKSNNPAIDGQRDPGRDQPPFGVRLLDEAISESLRTGTSNLTLLGASARLAALLAAVAI
jgi:hypothetical protein